MNPQIVEHIKDRRQTQVTAENFLTLRNIGLDVIVRNSSKRWQTIGRMVCFTN